MAVGGGWGGGARRKQKQEKVLEFYQKMFKQTLKEKNSIRILKRSKRLWKFFHPRWAEQRSRMKIFLKIFCAWKEDTFYFLFDGKFINRNSSKVFEIFFGFLEILLFFKESSSIRRSLTALNNIICQKNVNLLFFWRESWDGNKTHIQKFIASEWDLSNVCHVYTVKRRSGVPSTKWHEFFIFCTQI